MKVRFTGSPRDDHVFFVGNHLSWLDVPALGGITGTAFVAQDRIADWPVFGWLSKLNNTVFVSRTDKLAVGEQIETLRHAIARHRMLALFPEGTTTDGRSLLPFKAPLFAALDPPPPDMLIQPIVMDFDDTGKSLAWIGMETAPANGWRVLSPQGDVLRHRPLPRPLRPRHRRPSQGRFGRMPPAHRGKAVGNAGRRRGSLKRGQSHANARRMSSFPHTRLRRTRVAPWSRALHAENTLTPADLIWPIFVTEGKGVVEPIKTMPGVNRLSVDKLGAAAQGSRQPRHPLRRAVPQHPGRSPHRRWARKRSTPTISSAAPSRR